MFCIGSAYLSFQLIRTEFHIPKGYWKKRKEEIIITAAQI